MSISLAPLSSTRTTLSISAILAISATLTTPVLAADPIAHTANGIPYAKVAPGSLPTDEQIRHARPAPMPMLRPGQTAPDPSNSPHLHPHPSQSGTSLNQPVYYHPATPPCANIGFVNHDYTHVVCPTPQKYPPIAPSILPGLTAVPPATSQVVHHSTTSFHQPNPTPMNVGPTPQNVGTGGGTFQTYRVSPDAATMLYPNFAVGTIYMGDPTTGLWYQCTAVMIAPNVAMTAGHCVAQADPTNPHFYNSPNEGFFAGIGWQHPHPYGGRRILSMYTTDTWLYSNGGLNDQDVALLVLDPTNSTDPGAPSTEPRLGDLIGTMGWATGWLGDPNAAITEIAYPSNLDYANQRMITAAQSSTKLSNTIQIGTAQMHGSSGGPWIVNYNTNPSIMTNSASASANLSNTIVGVTSYGYDDGTGTTAVYQAGASILQPAGTPGKGFVDLWSTVCTNNPADCQ